MRYTRLQSMKTYLISTINNGNGHDGTDVN